MTAIGHRATNHRWFYWEKSLTTMPPARSRVRSR